MSKLHGVVATFFVLSAIGAAACSASPDDVADPTASSDNALGASAASAADKGPAPAPTTDNLAPSPGGNWLDFVGAWESAGTAPVHALVFQNTPDGIGHRFFARNNPSLTSAYAKKTSSPEGVYTVSKDFLNVEQKQGLPDLSGSYRYQFEGKDNDTLILSGGTMKVPETYKRIISYCDAPVDCTGQGITTVDCTGSWSCSKQHTCSWVCGVVDGEKCGDNICGKGTYCCNPLMGICTPPGIACFQ
jgi:hypothetical protein